jgi:hypothetical protein
LTTAIADHAIKYLKGHESEYPGDPFFYTWLFTGMVPLTMISFSSSTREIMP